MNWVNGAQGARLPYPTHVSAAMTWIYTPAANQPSLLGTIARLEAENKALAADKAQLLEKVGDLEQEAQDLHELCNTMVSSEEVEATKEKAVKAIKSARTACEKVKDEKDVYELKLSELGKENCMLKRKVEGMRIRGMAK